MNHKCPTQDSRFALISTIFLNSSKVTSSSFYFLINDDSFVFLLSIYSDPFLTSARSSLSLSLLSLEGEEEDDDEEEAESLFYSRLPTSFCSLFFIPLTSYSDPSLEYSPSSEDEPLKASSLSYLCFWWDTYCAFCSLLSFSWVSLIFSANFKQL